MKKVNIYTNKKYLQEGQFHVQLLYPFWGKEGGPYAEGTKHGTAFDKYMKLGKEYYQLVDEPKGCDIFLLPGKYTKKTDNFFVLQELSIEHKKPLIIFYDNDDNSQIDLENVIVFRTGGYLRDHEGKQVYGMPYWSSDYYGDRDFFTIVPASEKAKIGYSGYINYLNFFDAVVYYFKNFLKKVLGYKKEFRRDLRGKAVRTLLANDEINFQFFRKRHFGGKASKLDNHYNWFHFMDTIASCLYNLAIRGNGNWSIRFYEILNAGRIPLFLDTDCILPFYDKVNWNKYLVHVPKEKLGSIDKVLCNFHKSLSNNELKFMQRDIRKFYEEYLSPEGFFDKIRIYLK